MIDETDDDSLEFDLRRSLIDAARAPVFLGTFGHAMKEALLAALAKEAAPILRARTGGRYLPKSDKAQRRARDAAVVAADAEKLTRDQIARRFKISRRLVTSILSEARKRKAAQRF